MSCPAKFTTSKGVMLAGIEAICGVDPGVEHLQPILIEMDGYSVDIQATEIERKTLKSNSSPNPFVTSSLTCNIACVVEVKGGGAAATIPEFDPLIRACGCPRYDGVQIVVDDATKFQLGEVLENDGSNVDIGYIIDLENKNNTLFVKLTGSLPSVGDVVGGEQSTSTATVTSVKTAHIYHPTSERNKKESITIYFNHDGELYRATGVRGNVSFNMAVNDYGKMTFNFTGIYATPVNVLRVDVVAVTAAFSIGENVLSAATSNVVGSVYDWRETSPDEAGLIYIIQSGDAPEDGEMLQGLTSGASASTNGKPTYGLNPHLKFNTTQPPPCLGVSVGVQGFDIESNQIAIEAITFDLANVVNPVNSLTQEAGVQGIELSGRVPAGSFDPDVAPLTTWPIFKNFENGTLAKFSLQWGHQPGNTIRIVAPAVQFRAPTKKDRQGIQARDINFLCTDPNANHPDLEWCFMILN